MGRTLWELQHTMTSEEFGLWQEEYLRCPWGELRDELHAGLICRTIANYAGRMRKEGDHAQLSEFAFQFDREPDAEGPEPDPIAHFQQFMKPKV